MPVFLLSLAALLTFSVPQDRATMASEPCRFGISWSAPVATISGPDEIVKRVRLLAQPDSPIAITALDLTEIALVVGPGAYEWSGALTLEVMNVSDQPVSEVWTQLWIDHVDGSAGGGQRFGELLLPGQRRRTTAGVGRGRGKGDFRAEDVALRVFVDRASLDGCEYRPSLPIPIGR